MNVLLTFDAAPFTIHLNNEDDRNMIEFIIGEYGNALRTAIKTFGDEGIEGRIHMHYQEAYFNLVLHTGNGYVETERRASFRRRTIDDTGNVTSTKGRYDELVEACVSNFNGQIVAVLRGIQYQARQIYTVDVVGYDKNTLKILLKTDGAYIP